MISKHILLRALEMLPVASDDPTRFHIAGVNIVSQGGKVTLTATNGHMLTTRTLEGQCPEGEFILTRDSAKALKPVVADYKHLDDVPSALDPDGHLLAGAGGFGSIARIEKQPGSYPDYQQVIPKHRETVAITLNAEYLMALAKVLQEGNKRGAPNVRIVFDPAKPLSPALLERDGVDATCVVMPVRDSRSERKEGAA